MAGWLGCVYLVTMNSLMMLVSMSSIWLVSWTIHIRHSVRARTHNGIQFTYIHNIIMHTMEAQQQTKQQHTNALSCTSFTQPINNREFICVKLSSVLLLLFISCFFFLSFAACVCAYSYVFWSDVKLKNRSRNLSTIPFCSLCCVLYSALLMWRIRREIYRSAVKCCVFNEHCVRSELRVSTHTHPHTQ